MKFFEETNVEVPTSDVERKDFKIMFEMIILTIVVIIITLVI